MRLLPSSSPALAACLLTTMTLGAAPAGWVDDYEAARKVAAEAKLDLLLNFTGSDWSEGCASLKAEVFSQEEFKNGVKGKFLLVELDFPRDRSKLPPAVQQQNQKLATLYQVSGYPTIVLTDAAGRPYGVTSYREGGAQSYLAHLEQLWKNRNDRTLKLVRARQETGVGRARALQMAIADLTDEAVNAFYPEVVKEIASADPGDTTGFIKERNFRLASVEFEEALSALFSVREYDLVIARVDQFLAQHELSGVDQQRALMPKVLAYMKKGNREEAFRQIEIMRAADPESELAAQLDGIKARLAEQMKDNPPPANKPAPPSK